VWGERIVCESDSRVLADERFVVATREVNGTLSMFVDERVYPRSEFVHGHGGYGLT
jgi:hypothetical protein